MGLLLVALALLALAAVLVLVHGVAPEAPVSAPPAEKPGISPREFEQHCADILAARGWRVTIGRGTADQGVDVLARKDGRSVVLQCKLYSRPVGNKAVQEALAGCGYAGADGAAVVTNAAYTQAAHALAARVGVLLLHVSDLTRADTLFQFPAGAEAEPEPARTRRQAPARRPARARTWRLPGLALPALPARGWTLPGWRMPGFLLPAAVVAAVILLYPDLSPDGADQVSDLPRRIARPALPLPPPAPPPPERHAAR